MSTTAKHWLGLLALFVALVACSTVLVVASRRLPTEWTWPRILVGSLIFGIALSQSAVLPARFSARRAVVRACVGTFGWILATYAAETRFGFAGGAGLALLLGFAFGALWLLLARGIAGALAASGSSS